MIQVNSIFEVSAPITGDLTATVRYDRSYGKTFLVFKGPRAEILYWLNEFVADLEKDG